MLVQAEFHNFCVIDQCSNGVGTRTDDDNDDSFIP